MARPTSDSGTVTRKPDDAVGSRGEPPAGGGHQTADQAAITDIGGGGKPQPEPRDGWGATGEPGRSPPAVGGSSGGHSDQKASRGPAAGETMADGHYRAERENRE
ncbi:MULTISPECIES: hypothetical protein [unclassified Methylobacterium]|jgi:hypothetical protein|uniref:hypothetical protein n=1 Tax=unclassified Methylobacterium TaxID=2615210 RepID=UPI001352F03E|nr:hypothetical protein [Methylobacterium sp. 2A]MWV22329.1 hypothetical protein [Methylobacterium sp. 2A]